MRLAALNALGQLEVPEAWDVIAETVGSQDARLRLLATRLTEHRPGDRAQRAAAAHAQARRDATGSHDLVEAPPPVRDGSWPAPDLGPVTREGSPLAQRPDAPVASTG